MRSLKSHLFALPVFSIVIATGVVVAEPDTTSPPAIGNEEPALPSPADLTATRCLTCHGNNQAGRQRLAPPFAMVKMHYQSLDEASFIKTVSDWIKEPQKQKSKMPGAINRFGLMPPPGCSEAEAAIISKHIFHTDFPMLGPGGKGMGSGPGGGDCGPNTTAGPNAGAGCEEECGSTASAAPKNQKDGQTAKSTAPKTEDHCAPTDGEVSKTVEDGAPAAKIAVSKTEECCGPTEKTASTVAAEPTEKAIPAAPALPKRPVPPTMMNHLKKLESDLTTFKNTETADHADLAMQIEKNLNLVISSCTMEGEDHDVLHAWLLPFLKLTKEHAKSTDVVVQTKKVDEMRGGITAFHEQFEPAPQS